MHRMILSAALSGLAVTPAAAQQPLRVYVSARTVEALSEPDRKAREKETEASQQRAEEARKNLQKSLEARHGKKWDNWPEDARHQFEAARQEEYKALLAHHEVKVDQKDVDGLAQALANTLRGVARKSSHLTVADTSETADLAVEVLTRRAKTSFPAAAWLLYLKVQPVKVADASALFAGTSFGQMKTQQAYLGQIMGVQKLRGGLATLHAYSEAEPYWIIEVVQQGTSYAYVLMAAADALEGFAGGLTEPTADASTTRR